MTEYKNRESFAIDSQETLENLVELTLNCLVDSGSDDNGTYMSTPASVTNYTVTKNRYQQVSNVAPPPPPPPPPPLPP